MARLRTVLALIFTSLLSFVAFPGMARSATPQIAESADRIVSLRNVNTTVNEVSGEIVNNSRDELRDVSLEILYSWRWNNEMHPGNNPLGGTFYHTVEREIAPGQSTPFTFRPPTPMQMRNDGYYVISARVVGYSQVYRGERR